ncbi:hypothetical protein C0995_001946 [Termitomyces sp. Mi166|nr:hypothetical protein C0995_001946 [Termitomyces sp. Mi166\
MTPNASSPSKEPQQQTLSGEPQQQTLSGEPQQQTLPGEPQQQTLSGEPELQSLSDLRIPHLMNTIYNGKRVPHLVLAFPFTRKEQFRCAEVNNLMPESSNAQRSTVALCQVRNLLPRPCRTGAIRSKESGVGFIMAILVASNATPRTLALARNIDLLKEVQRILGTEENPRSIWLPPAGHLKDLWDV